jgi:curved DNA-binding protein CbpA
MFERPSDQNHYQVLEISERASAEEIQSAYERAKEIYGTDSVVSSSILAPDERRQILERVTDAYHTLIAEESRRLYDRSLAAPSPSRNPQNGSSPTPPATRVGYVAGTSPSASPAHAYPRLVELRPRGANETGAETDAPLERINVALGAKEEATGEFLRKAREASGVDLRSISQETKIGVTMLGYIEEERLERLPVEVYLRNFVRQYARCLGLEDERIALSYVARIRRLQSKGSDPR